MTAERPNLCLGLDCSTQSLTAVVLDIEEARIVHQESVNFDSELSHFGTQAGVLVSEAPGTSDSPPVQGKVHAPPLLWVEALDLLLARLSKAVPLAKVAAIGGSAQQHGSVYLSADATGILANLTSDRDLAPQIVPLLTRPTSPIWQDTSTTVECDEIRTTLGGIAACAELTGSDIFERFTGPQIRRFSKSHPEAYEHTAHICLVSSFMASLLSGQVAPMDTGDAAGTNLIDIQRFKWSEAALNATAPNLRSRLPNIQQATTPIGSIAPYFTERYGFSPATQILPWTGDNPASLVGLGLIHPGDFGISLGTSDTCFAPLDHPTFDPTGCGHVFGNPLGGWMSLVCFRNGSLAREAVRDRYGLDWEGFEQAVESEPPGNRGRLMLPWLEPEITPRVAVGGDYRSPDLDPDDAPANCRAILEGQALSMRLHSEAMGATATQILVTGGASGSTSFLGVLADIFQCSVSTGDTASGAALGAAAYAAIAVDGNPKDRQMRQRLSKRLASSNRAPIAPNPENHEGYGRLGADFEAHSKRTLATLSPFPGA